MITLATLSSATAQEVFDQVARHLLTQNERSMMITVNGPKCAYRGPDGIKCAAGCLISDEEMLELEKVYQNVKVNPCSDFNTINWDELVRYLKVTPVHRHLILSLQKVHDKQSAPVSSWKAGLLDVALVNDLNPAVLQEFN